MWYVVTGLYFCPETKGEKKKRKKKERKEPYSALHAFQCPYISTTDPSRLTLISCQAFPAAGPPALGKWMPSRTKIPASWVSCYAYLEALLYIYLFFPCDVL
jgi:hypothetical protein